MEINNNKTSSQTPEESVTDFTADDNSYSFKIIDSDEKYVKFETEVMDNCVFHSIVEIPKATDQSKVLVSKDNESLQSNLFLNYGSRNQTFDCCACEEKFKLKLHLDQHVEKYHNQNIKVLVQNILNHGDAHDNNSNDASTSKEESNCALEKKTYAAKHMKAHNHPSSYKEEFLNNFGLVTIPVYESLKQNLEKRPMLCRRCEIEFERKDLYSRHIQFCRKRLYEKNNINDKKFVCTVCGKHFSNALLLKNHITSSRGHWICTYCKVVFSTSDLFSKHMVFRKTHNLCLKVDETCVKRGRGRNKNVKNTINSTPIKDSNVIERKLTLRFHGNIENIKQEPINIDHGNALTNDNIKQEPIDLDIGNGLTADNIKQEPIDLDLGNGLTADNIKQEPTDLDLGNGLTADNKRNNTVEFTCTSCELSLSNIHSLALHMATHENRSKYKCKLCKKRYKLFRPWINHLTNHQQQLDLIMSQDNPEALEFNINRNVLRQFEAHITALISIKNKNHIKLEPQVNASPSVFNGDLAETNNFEGEQSNSVNEFQQNEKIEHLNSLHNARNAVIKKEPTSEHQCNVCQKRLVNAINLTRHMNIHTGLQMPFKCQLCHRPFKTRGNLTNHMKGSQCPIKNEQLSTRNDDNLEILSPFELKPFMCQICNRLFTSNKGMKIHLKSHYRYKNNYQRDEMANKNDTKKHCNQYDKKFSKINAFQASTKAQHPPEYKCDDCGERFKTNFHLGIHIVNKHK